MNIGIDFGYTTTDIVALKDNKVVKKLSLLSTRNYPIEFLLKKIKVKENDIENIGVTGGRSKYLSSHVDEITAIGLGGSFLAKKDKCLVASLGTGTCIVNVNKKNVKHIGGTGVGGGTIVGLCNYLVKVKDVDIIEGMAQRGNLKNVDVSVKDIVGGNIGIIPGRLTASNLGKMKSKKKEDKLLAAVNLVAESNAMLVIMAANYKKQQNIVLTGKVTNIKTAVKIMRKIGKIYNRQFIVPKHSDVATAVGAALAEA